ncbi:hypothetical protein [Flavobacterium sp.]|uniref:hypothetical protein n=1 Tax=Flavobacterium sp. TaxID=239 RepID=UPI0040336DBF
MNTLKIKDYTFPINLEKSFIKEYNNEDFDEAYTVWDVWIQSKEAPFAGEGIFSGNIRCEKMIAKKGNLQSISGTTIHINDAYDHVTKEHLFTFYMLTHNGVKDNEITFGKIEGNKVIVYWKGIIEELGFDSDYNIDVPFELSCELEIKEMVATDDYHTPSSVVKRYVEGTNDDPDNNRNILDLITDITDHHRLSDEAYDALIKLLCNESFLKTFEVDTDPLEDFISNFTHFTDDLTSPVPKSVIKKAIKKWCGMVLLQDFVEDDE